jgi:hypothetical protein
MSPQPPESQPDESSGDLSPTPGPATTSVLTHRPNRPDSYTDTHHPAQTSYLPPYESSYPSKAGAVIECSYRPSSPGIETPEETRKRLGLGDTEHTRLKTGEIAEIKAYFDGIGRKAVVRKEREGAEPEEEKEGAELEEEKEGERGTLG